jgi:hypothetical protein
MSSNRAENRPSGRPSSRLPIRRYSLEFKCQVLSHLSNQNGAHGNKSQCARDFGIHRRFITKWNKQRDDIFASSNKSISFRVNNNRISQASSSTPLATTPPSTISTEIPVSAQNNSPTTHDQQSSNHAPLSRDLSTTTQFSLNQLTNDDFFAYFFNIFMTEMMATQNAMAIIAQQQPQNSISTTMQQQPQTSIATSIQPQAQNLIVNTGQQPREVLNRISMSNNRANNQQSAQKSKAGRKPMPRDANGKIIRPEPFELNPPQQKRRKTNK